MSAPSASRRRDKLIFWPLHLRLRPRALAIARPLRGGWSLPPSLLTVMGQDVRGVPGIRGRHQMFICRTAPEPPEPSPTYRVSLLGPSQFTSRSAVGQRLDGPPCSYVATSNAIPEHAALAVRRPMDDRGQDGGLDAYRYPDLSQSRPGTRHPLGGRTRGTGRNTRDTLVEGYTMAIAEAVVRYGEAEWIKEYGIVGDEADKAAGFHEFLLETLEAKYRGQVWTLDSMCGAVARFSADDQHKHKEPELVVCWVASRGDVQCTCKGSTAFEATLDKVVPVPEDALCAHAMAFSSALSKIAWYFGDDGTSKVRAHMARLYNDDRISIRRRTGQAPAAKRTQTKATARKNQPAEDAEVEVFATAGLPVAVVVSGDGVSRVPAPVRCARKATSCCYCDTSRKKSCCHVLHTRHLRQSDAAARGTNPKVTHVQSISYLPLSTFNCIESVKVDVSLFDAARRDEPYVVPAPSACLECKQPRGDAPSDPASGTVLSEMCIGRLLLDAYTCTNQACGKWVCSEGRESGLVILSPCTAASVSVVRHFASQVAVEGNPFNQVFRTWWSAALGRQRAGVWSPSTPIRSRRTVARLLSAGLRLLGKDVPAWPFFCGPCCDGDAINVVTADGIWLGYMRRLAGAAYETYAERCVPSPELLETASLIGSEWVRRFLRLALTEPGNVVAVSVDQRKAATQALAILQPSALPASYLTTSSRDDCGLREMLGSIWQLDVACVSLAKGVLLATTKRIAAAQAANEPLPPDALERQVAVAIASWLVPSPPPPAPAPLVGAGPAGAAAAGALVGANGAVGAGVAPVAAPPRVPPASPFATFRPELQALGATAAHDVVSFCVALATDPVVSAFNKAHVPGIRALAAVLRSPSLATELPPLLAEAVREGLSDAAQPDDMNVDAVKLLRDQRITVAFLSAMRRLGPRTAVLAVALAKCLDEAAACLETYHAAADLAPDSAALFGSRWCGAGRTKEELCAAFRASFPHASSDPLVTGVYFPGRSQCRPSAFGRLEVPELGACSKNYQAARKSFSPGAFIICCACAHPKVLGFVVLDKREGPPALLDAIITRFFQLPRYIVYDFGCGAVRSALAKLPWLLEVSTIVSDAFHVINHVCSKYFSPASFTVLKHVNTVAHEQRNRAIKMLHRVLAASGQVEYTRILSYHMIVHNIRAAARDACPSSLPEFFDYAPFYFSREACLCGCSYTTSDPFGDL